MLLTPGTFIGHYEILESLGAGGMGEVYRARDTRLGREVAVKILSPEFASHADRLARFQREATTLASLNHAHIAHIYGVEERGSAHALIMELVHGEDLARRVLRGRIALDEALAVATQIADALEAAHDAGIIHRDLKPANVMLRADGQVKILDFGLAKVLHQDGSAAALANSPTVSNSGMTRAGAVLGTAAYMSPEQASGRSVDRRADIWAFGCVLFEMLTGRGCFHADSLAETLARVLEREPAWDALPPSTPEAIRRLLARCLQKDPRRRLHDIADARLELDDAIAAPPARVPAGSRATGRWWPYPLAAALLVGGAAALLPTRQALPARPNTRVDRLTDLPGLEEDPAFSPDGKSVAFTAAVGNTRQIFVQLLAGGTPLRLTHDSFDHQYPRWSPDSSSVVYFSPATSGNIQGAIWQVSALGGAPRRLADTLAGADINIADGRLAFFRLGDKRIELVSASSEAAIESVADFEPSTYYLYPRWSPDGKWIAFQRGDSIRFDIFVVSSKGGAPRQLTHDNTMMSGFAWLPDSSAIVYSSSRGQTMPYLATSALWEVSLADGSVRQITSGETSYMHPDIARSGAIVAARLRIETDIWKFPVGGAPGDNARNGVRVTRQTGQVLTPTSGPGDREIAFLSDSGGHANLWVIDTESGERRQITQERDPNVAVGVPVWSPDGRAIAFVSSRGNQGLTFGVWLVKPDGSDLRNLANPGLGPAWSHDGRWVYYSTRGDRSTDVVLRKIPVAGGKASTVRTERLRNVIGSDGTTLYFVLERPLVDGTPEFEVRAATPEAGQFRVLARISPSRVPTWQIVNPAMSPDGRWLAQALTDGFATNIWALSTASGEWRQITDFGERPTFIARRVSWSSDGRYIFAAVGEGDADIVRLSGFLELVTD